MTKPDLPILWRAGSHLYLSLVIDDSEEIAAEHGREAEALYREMAEQRPEDERAQVRWRQSQRIVKNMEKGLPGIEELHKEDILLNGEGAEDLRGPTEHEVGIKDEKQ